MIGAIWSFAKQLLLWHNAESLEERPAVGGLHGKRLRAAEILLQKAVVSARDPDAIFLLAEMNFVCLHLHPSPPPLLLRSSLPSRDTGLTGRQYGNWSHSRNYSDAFKWYKKLADLTGNSTAQHMVGFIYATGIGGAVPKDQGQVRPGPATSPPALWALTANTS